MQGILITAYKNVDQLLALSDFFDDEFRLFIHIDQRSCLDVLKLEALQNRSNVDFVTHKYRTNWGGRNHLLAILCLVDKALGCPELDYFHLISGSDFPIHSIDYYHRFVKENAHVEFLDVHRWADRGEHSGFWHRIEYFNCYDVFDGKGRSKVLLTALKDVQRWLHWRRAYSVSLPDVYGGSTWWSLSRPCLEYVRVYTQEKTALLNRMKHTFCSEEVYFQTVIMQSPFAARVVNDDMRYIDWNKRNGNSPAVLDQSDFEALCNSKKLFARKVEPPVSDQLVELLTACR